MERSKIACLLKIERAKDKKPVGKIARGWGKLAFCLLLFSFFALLSTCGGVPETFYYTLAIEQGPPPNNGPVSFPFALGVEKFQAETIYDDDRIIYRDSPFEVKYYYYRRWAAPPRHLVTEIVLRYLSDSGLFEKVVAYPSVTNVKYVLSGRLLAFEEWDEQNHWYGKITFSAHLYDPVTQRIVWNGKFEHLQPVTKKIPVAVVEAINIGLKKCFDDLARSLLQELGPSNVAP